MKNVILKLLLLFHIIFYFSSFFFRLPEGVVSVESCPASCSTRHSCSDCLDNGRCVWCRATNVKYFSSHQKLIFIIVHNVVGMFSFF